MNGEPDIPINILPESQKRLLHKITKALSGADFYLAGGTALALQIGHRQSIDFDWFIFELGDPEILFKRLKSVNIDFRVTSTAIETVYLNVDNIQVSFFGYDYPMLQPIIVHPVYGMRMAGPDDIACMKLSAIASRGSRKDFTDLYFLVKLFKPLEDYLKLYTQKFSTRDIGHIVRSLVYFEDAESEPELAMLKPMSWNDLKSEFEMYFKNLSQLTPYS